MPSAVARIARRNARDVKNAPTASVSAPTARTNNQVHDSLKVMILIRDRFAGKDFLQVNRRPATISFRDRPIR
jgi:hypothetical protein